MGLAKVILQILQTEEWGILRPFPEAGCPGAPSEHGRGHRESSGIAHDGSAQNRAGQEQVTPRGTCPAGQPQFTCCYLENTQLKANLWSNVSHSVLFSSAETKLSSYFVLFGEIKLVLIFSVTFQITSSDEDLTGNSSLMASACSVDQQHIRASPCSRSPHYWSLPRPLFMSVQEILYLAELELCC